MIDPADDPPRMVDLRARARKASNRWAGAVAVALALVVSATAFAASLAPPPLTPRALGDMFFGPQMARAEVIMVAGGAVHDVRIDQGRVLSLSPTSLVVLERDGTRQTIAVAPTTQIVGRPGPPARGIQPKTNALAIREGDGPAQSIYVTVGANRVVSPKVLGQLFMTQKTARAEVVTVEGGAVHDFRIDQGRIVGTGPGAVVLLERDGTRQTVPVSPATEVWLGEQLADVSALEVRMTVLTIRDGDQPAQTIRAGAARLQGRRQ